jgi:hypothetical protein
MNNWKTLMIAAILLAFASCKTTRDTSVTIDKKVTSYNQDSSYVHETLHQDSINIKKDTASMFLPTKWIGDTIGAPDPAPLQRKQGRATLSVIRKAGGLQITASCDSLLFVLQNREREIFRLRSQMDSTSSVKSESSKVVNTVFKVPVWMIIVLLVSIAFNVLIIVLQIKKRLL